MKQSDWSLRLTKKIAEPGIFVSKWAGIVFIFIMAVMVAVGTIGRYGFHRPITAVDELASYMLLVTILFGAAYTLRERGHTRVDFVTAKLPPRVGAWLTVVTDLVSIVVCALFLMVTLKVTQTSFETNARALGVLMLPLGPVQILMPIAFLFLSLEFVHQLIISFKKALGSSAALQPEAEAFQPEVES